MPELDKVKAAFVPVLMVTIGLSWSVIYVLSVQGNPDHDNAATALIGPLLWIMIPLGILTALQAIWDSLRGHLTEQHGLNDNKRRTYFVALSLLLFGLPWLGFLGACVPFFIFLSFYLGFRQRVVLIVLSAMLTLVIWLVFYELLSISLPLFPGYSS